MTALNIILIIVFIIVDIYKIAVYHRYNAKVKQLSREIENNRAEQIKRINDSIKSMKSVNMDKIREYADEYYGVKK
jgi:hypothetical protein